MCIRDRFKDNCNVMQVFERQTIHSRTYVSMEYAGVSLEKLEFRTRVLLDPCLQQMEAILEALRLNSKPVLHRDIKPANICVREDRFQLVLVDFGTAVDANEFVQNVSGIISGTPLYWSPFHINPMGVTEATCFLMDEWSMAVTLFELVFRRVPFEGKNPANMVLMVQTGKINVDGSIYGYLVTYFMEFFSALRQVAEVQDTKAAPYMISYIQIQIEKAKAETFFEHLARKIREHGKPKHLHSDFAEETRAVSSMIEEFRVKEQQRRMLSMKI